MLGLLSNDIKRMIGDTLNSAHNRNALRSIDKSFKSAVQPSVQVPLRWNNERKYQKGARQLRNGRWSVPYRPPSGNRFSKVRKDGYIPSSRPRVYTTKEPHKRKTGEIFVSMPVSPNLTFMVKSRGGKGDPKLRNSLQRALRGRTPQPGWRITQPQPQFLHPYGIPYITFNNKGKAILHTLVE
jgi:hypothetical protein